MVFAPWYCFKAWEKSFNSLEWSLLELGRQEVENTIFYGNMITSGFCFFVTVKIEVLILLIFCRSDISFEVVMISYRHGLILCWKINLLVIESTKPLTYEWDNLISIILSVTVHKTCKTYDHIHILLLTSTTIQPFSHPTIHTSIWSTNKTIKPSTFIVLYFCCFSICCCCCCYCCYCILN